MIFPEIKAYLQKASAQKIPEDRKELLNKLVVYILEKKQANKPVQLNFICTHNSRRSQLAQAWAQITASYHNIPVCCYSGGVEETAFYKSAYQVLENSGIKIVTEPEKENPVIWLYYSAGCPPLKMFSKIFDHAINPNKNFAAVMTCSHADENCPFIPGAENRIPITYEDPKIADNTSEELEKYTERSLQIASEMFYVFSQIKKQDEK